MWAMPGRSYRGASPALAGEEERLRERLTRHVESLAGDIGERNVHRPEAYREAAGYVAGVWEEMGYAVARQGFTSQGLELANLEVELRGGAGPERIVVLGAHYDSVIGSPGANDNATGVAALLELSRRFHGATPARTLRFVAFANEEPPFFQTPGEMGSRVYARRSRERGEEITAMLSLETLGAYSDEPGSQRFPAPLLGWIYPDTADFIAFVGDLSSRRLLRRAVGAFRRTARFPSEGALLPRWVPGAGWSDHWSFWREGYPAAMVTDTALFRYPHYHRPTDTPDKVDYDGLTRVVLGLEGVVEELGG